MNFSEHPSLDHREPPWVEGRDYQLVCGLENNFNYRYDTVGNNSRKSNRFIPWRQYGESVPEEPGDLAFFLVDGEWKLFGWLSKEWFLATKGTSGESFGNVGNPKGNPKNLENYYLRCKQDPILEAERIKRCRENFAKSRSENGKRNKGRKYSSEVNAKKGRAGELNSAFGQRWYNDGERNIRLSSNEQPPAGFKPGMLKRKPT